MSPEEKKTKKQGNPSGEQPAALEKETNEETSSACAAPVGCTSATERDPTTSGKFSFWLSPDVIVNPFDIVQVQQVSQPAQPPSVTYGLVTTLEHRTDAPNHLANFISNDFGTIPEEPNTPRQGTTVAHANVLSNNADIYMPVPSERPVTFADAEGIYTALGIDVLMTERPYDAIPAGLIKLSSGASAVAHLDSRYLLGPESAHVNISGISGLATKTSYAMYLIQAILQKARHPEKIAVIIMNVKHGDLLQLDLAPDELPPEQRELWQQLGLKPSPFKNVHYLLPRSRRPGVPNSHIVPATYTVYGYDLPNTADKLDFLFAQIPDAYGTLASIIGEIRESYRTNDKEFRNVQSFEQLLTGPPLFDQQRTAPVKEWRGIRASSIGVFRRHMRRIIYTNQTGLFAHGALSNREKILGDEIRKIRGGHVYVVDIAKVRDEEQTLVFGDVLRTVYEIKAEGAEDEKGNIIEAPERVIFFVDELNKYAPRGRIDSSITDQVLEVAERGRSLGVILISAQQFMSAVHERVTGNCATKIIGRTGSSEVSASDYRFLDDEIKMNLTRLSKGELIASHALYRQPVKVIFPLPAYKQPTG
jgi:hypothetical protein